MKKLTPTLLALLLSACGGGTVYVATPAPVLTPPAEPFFARVMGFVGMMPDDAEAADISAVVASAPENAEPTGI